METSNPYIIAGLISLAVILAQVIRSLVDRRWPMPMKVPDSSLGMNCNGQCKWDHEAAERLQAIYSHTKAINDTIAGTSGLIAINSRMIRDLDTITHRLESLTTMHATHTAAQAKTVGLLERLMDRVPTS